MKKKSKKQSLVEQLQEALANSVDHSPIIDLVMNELLSKSMVEGGMIPISCNPTGKSMVELLEMFKQASVHTSYNMQMLAEDTVYAHDWGVPVEPIAHGEIREALHARFKELGVPTNAFKLPGITRQLIKGNTLVVHLPKMPADDPEQEVGVFFVRPRP